MSDAANREREVKQHWAEPGSKHDAVVKAMKVGLPVLVGIFVAVLLTAPLTKKGEVSFILDKNEVETAPERMRIEQARYTGTDDKGQRFEITANRAIQRSSEQPIVDIRGMMARLGLPDGVARIQAMMGRYNLDKQQVAVPGPVQVRGPKGEQFAASDVMIDFKTQTVRSDKPVQGRVELGQFSAGGMHADIANHVVVLDGGARLKIVQGAIK